MHVGLSLYVRAAQAHNRHGQQRRWEFCMQPPHPAMFDPITLIVVAVRGETQIN